VPWAVQRAAQRSEDAATGDRLQDYDPTASAGAVMFATPAATLLISQPMLWSASAALRSEGYTALSLANSPIAVL